MNKENFEKIIILISIGLLEALKYESVNFEDLEKTIFGPHLLKFMQSNNIDENLIDLISSGMELEDIQRIVPENFHESLSSISKGLMEALKELPDFKNEEKRWYEGLDITSKQGHP